MSFGYIYDLHRLTFLSNKKSISHRHDMLLEISNLQYCYVSKLTNQHNNNDCINKRRCIFDTFRCKLLITQTNCFLVGFSVCLCSFVSRTFILCSVLVLYCCTFVGNKHIIICTVDVDIIVIL